MIKQISTLIVGTVAVLSLTGCDGHQHNAAAGSSNSRTTRTSHQRNVTVRKVKVASSSKSVAASSQSSASATSSSATATSSSHNDSKSLDVNAIAQENFSSLVGTWTNPQTGATLVVTNQTLAQPGNAYQGVTKGALVSGHDVDGHPEVIVRNADTATNGTLAVTGCYFGGVPATTPMLLVQRGAKGAANDDSDSSRDRIIFGAGQGGFADEAYYRQ